MEQKNNGLFSFMAIGCTLYAFLYTVFLYKNAAGITYPFFVGGTCLFFFLYLKKSGITAKKYSLFHTICLMLLGISTCLTDSWILLFLNKLGILLLFFYMVLHNLYDDTKWDLPKYLGSIINILCSSLVYIFKPLTDLADYCKQRAIVKNKSDGKGRYVVFGILIALPILLIVILLLCSADAVFSSIFSTISFDFLDILLDGNFFGILALFLYAFLASYAIMSRISVHDLKEEVEDHRLAEPIMGITITAALSFVYLIFCGIQVIFLFGGLGTLPENYTYASYAREGFFQLVFVCLINLALVLICLKRFRPHKILKGLLTFISICTYIMIASSVYRMLLYIDVYFLTFLRVFVLWALLVISLLMSGTLILIYKEEFPFVRFCVTTVTVLYIAFSLMHPDYWIAQYNISKSYGSAQASTDESDSAYQDYFTDYYYFYDLSLDAAPVILKNADKLGYASEDWYSTYCKRIVKSTYSDDAPGVRQKRVPIRKWNFSRWYALRLYDSFVL